MLKLTLLTIAAVALAGNAWAGSSRKTANATAVKMNCAGSEPFWGASLEINEEKGLASISFKGADDRKETVFKKMNVQKTNNDGTVSFLKSSNNRFFAALVNSAGRGAPCLSEGETPENEHPFEIMMMIGNTPFVGCCK